jgi:hypothetical protein
MSEIYDGSQLCAQTDGALFFAEGNNPREDIAMAIKLCHSCPLFKPCEEYAASQVGLYGVWAGKWYTGLGYKSPLVLMRKEER